MNRGKSVVPDSMIDIRKFKKWIDEMNLHLMMTMVDEA